MAERPPEQMAASNRTRPSYSAEIIRGSATECCASRFLVHVGIDELTDATIDRIHQAPREFLLQIDAALGGVDDVIEKLHYYIKSFSPWLDVFVMLRTIKTILTVYGAR